MGGPLKLKFANHYIIYQNCPLRGHFGTGRLHSQLWDWGRFSLVTVQLCLRKPPSVNINVDNQTVKAVTNINKFVTIISRMSPTFGSRHYGFTKITFTLVTWSISQIQVSKASRKFETF